MSSAQAAAAWNSLQSPCPVKLCCTPDEQGHEGTLRLPACLSYDSEGSARGQKEGPSNTSKEATHTFRQDPFSPAICLGVDLRIVWSPLGRSGVSTLSVSLAKSTRHNKHEEATQYQAAEREARQSTRSSVSVWDSPLSADHCARNVSHVWPRVERPGSGASRHLVAPLQAPQNTPGCSPDCSLGTAARSGVSMLTCADGTATQAQASAPALQGQGTSAEPYSSLQCSLIDYGGALYSRQVGAYGGAPPPRLARTGEPDPLRRHFAEDGMRGQHYC